MGVFAVCHAGGRGFESRRSRSDLPAKSRAVGDAWPTTPTSGLPARKVTEPHLASTWP